MSLLAALLSIFVKVQVIAAICAALAVIFYLGHLFAERRERNLRASRVDQIADAVDLDHVLRDTATNLGLGGQGQGWRLTLYRLEFDSDPNDGKDEGRWELEARAANQKAYELSRDLVTMTLRQGVLRSAITAADGPSGGIDEIPPLPDPDTDPVQWQEMMAIWGIGEADIVNGMRSRVYCGRVYRVGLGRGKGLDMTLALVAESESPTGVRRQVMEEALTRPVFELFYELIKLRDEMRATLVDLAT